ncbi:hypothetical protein AUJ84_02610 [Candidatus Pacearchaeota archaeon CG1_02_32_132]|nr:MAG: hypothetical protein AUJ84_02610 [Candidatus Pacearchaeota archaeon CG1_02_32_132]
MRKRWFVIPVVLFLVIGSILFFPRFYAEDSPVLTVFNTLGNNNSDNPGGSGSNGGGGGSSSGSGSFGGSGGNGGGSGGSGGGSGGCIEGIIPHAVKNLRFDEECMEFQDNLCINKRIECIFDVYNLDYSIAGDFGFNLYVIEKNGNSGNAFDSVYIEKFIATRDNVEMSNSFNILGEGAGKNLDCVYASQKIPERVC